MASKRVLVASLGMLAAGSTASATDVTGALTFVGITPCRIIETRAGNGFSGANGPPSLVANANRTFQITGTVTGVPIQCGIPSIARAISVNFTATGFTGQGDIRVFPAGGTLPLTSILNYQLENIANATSVPLGPSGGGEYGIAVRADAAATDFIADVNGYYVNSRDASTCAKVAGIWWCYDAANCGQACNTVCANLGFPLAISDAAWLAAQNTAAKCQAINDAFGLGGTVSLASYTYACLEDAGGTETAPGGPIGPLFCSTFAACPTNHRTNMDSLGTACGAFSRRSICPCQ